MQNAQTIGREVSEKTRQAICSALVGKLKFHLYQESRHVVSLESYMNTGCRTKGTIDLRGNMNTTVEEGGRVANKTKDYIIQWTREKIPIICVMSRFRIS